MTALAVSTSSVSYQESFMTTNSIIDPTKIQIHWGKTPTGKKKHLGMDISFAMLRGAGDVSIFTFCGCGMDVQGWAGEIDYEESEDFCKVCTRQVRDRLYKEFLRLAVRRELASDKLRQFIILSEAGNWTAQFIIGEAKKLVEELALQEAKLLAFTAELTREQVVDLYKRRNGDKQLKQAWRR